MANEIRKQVLLIDKSPVTMKIVHDALKSDQVDVHHVYSIRYAENFILRNHIDLIVSEIFTNEDGDTFDFIRSTSSEQSHQINKIILSRKSGINHKVAAYNAGVDDYICKPFHPQELRLRVCKELGILIDPISYCLHTNDSTIVDLDERYRELKINKVKVKLSVTEFQIMYHLIKNNSYCPIEDLRKYLSVQKGKDLEVETMRVAINRLRKKLEISTGMKMIKNRHGQAYYLAV